MPNICAAKLQHNNERKLLQFSCIGSISSVRLYKMKRMKWMIHKQCDLKVWTSFVWSEPIDFCEKRSYFLRFCRAYPYLRWFPDWSVEDYTQNHINWLIDQPSVRIRKMEAKILHSSCNACNSSMKYCNLHSCMLSKNAVSVLRALCKTQRKYS